MPVVYWSIEKLLHASETSSVAWGDLILAVTDHGSCGNSTIAFFAGGFDNFLISDIQKMLFTIGSIISIIGNLLSFRINFSGTSNEETALWGGGDSGIDGNTFIIDLIDKNDFSQETNSTFFGSLASTTVHGCASSDNTTALFIGGVMNYGWQPISTAQSVEFATESDSSSFGDLMQDRIMSGSCTGS